MRRLFRHPPIRKAPATRGIGSCSEAAQTAGEHGVRHVRETARQTYFSAQKRAAAVRFVRRRGEHGSAVLESFLCMILIGMILFGILQLFQLALADMIAEYAAFRGARSHVVGFNDQYAFREALIKSAPASGGMITPDPDSYPGYLANSAETERTLLRGFMQGDRNVEYAYWLGGQRIHTNYHCPQYGETMQYACGICGTGHGGRSPYVRMEENGGPTSGSSFRFEFRNYPLHLPLHDWLTGRDSVTITSKAELQRSPAFLE